MDVSLIPFVCGAGGSTPGAEQGALYCYEHHLEITLQKAGIAADWLPIPHADWADIFGQEFHVHLEPRGHKSRHDAVSWHNQKLSNNVATAITSGKRAVTIGGDHSMAAGSVAGLQTAVGKDKTLGLVWVDAHTDLHSYASSTSKALHGMPVGTLLGLDNTLAIPGCSYPIIKPENLVYAGLRDVDPGEIINAQQLRLPIPSMQELRQKGMGESLEASFNRLKNNCDHIVLSIDLDGFAEALAPAVGTMVPGGFIYDEIMPALIKLVQTASVPLIEVVELNPTLPGADKTYQLLVAILEDLLKEPIKSS